MGILCHHNYNTFLKSAVRLNLRVVFLLLLLLTAHNNIVKAQYQPSPENLKARQEFSDYKFGIFLHWGIYSMFGQGEWYLNDAGINCHEYAKAASGFYPSRFDAAQWVSLFKEAGAKYVCFTTRHHDSFSMFKTRYSDFNIVDATPFKRDIVGELAEACHQQDVQLHLYYSHLDWTREDYYPLGRTGQHTGRTKHGNWNEYYRFMNNQLTELLTNYGKIGAIWFDGMWDQPDDFNWQLEQQYALIHRLQPACLVGNNHHKHPNPGEDFQMFERDLPGENNAGFSEHTEIGNLPLETCQTMNGTWGYNIKDQNYKSVKELVRLLVSTAGKGANLLINIGPQPDGEIPALAIDRLKGIGNWLNRYGETIYGTRAGCIKKADWGTTTRKNGKIYVHVLTDQMPAYITLPMTERIRAAYLFDSKERVHYDRIKGGIVLYTKNLKADTDLIITLEVK